MGPEWGVSMEVRRSWGKLCGRLKLTVFRPCHKHLGGCGDVIWLDNWTVQCSLVSDQMVGCRVVGRGLEEVGCGVR